MEVMISMLIMTIAFFAILMTQGTALDGYGATRDGTAAAEVGKSVIELMQLEAMQWRDGCFNTTAPANMYASGNTPFTVEQLLPTIQGNSWATWTTLTAAPVDVRLASGAEINGRFCVFARGDFREVELGDTNAVDAGGVFQCSPVFQSQIAVVYPSANGTLTDCTDVTQVDPADFTPESTEALEIKGLRVSYVGTVVMRREWIP